MKLLKQTKKQLKKNLRKIKTKKYKKNKTKKNNKKYKGGAPFDESFLRCFPENLTKIEAAIVQFSGKHSIDIEIAEQFINGQISDVRKQAARDLVENTIYIQLAEVSSIIEQLIIKLYTEHNLNSAENIYFFSGQPEKSFYFMSVLALKYIRKNGFKEPTHFISELNDSLFDIIGSAPLVILDDVSYSGAQLSDMLSNIYFTRVVKSKKEIPNIFTMLIALNDFSKAKVSMVPSKKTGSGITLKSIVSPFKLLFLPERLYTPLIIRLGVERYFYLNVFFSPYTYSTPYISLYLDHKISDEASTYKNALLYGPIVPSNYDYNKMFITYDYANEIIPIPDIFEPQTQFITNLYKDFNRSNSTNFKRNIEVVPYLCQKLQTIDIFEPGILHISFKPFINECNQSPQLLENISDTDIINFNYSLFMSPQGCIEEDKKECIVSDINQITNFFATEFFTTMSKEKAIEISKKIHSFRCPSSWYKKGEFKMICISE
jgi:hypothetical protein